MFQVEYSSVNIELLSYSFHYYYYYSLKELGLIRRPVSFTSTICDDRGEELLYAGMPISHVIEQDLGIGGVLGLLWFKRR